MENKLTLGLLKKICQDDDEKVINPEFLQMSGFDGFSDLNIDGRVQELAKTLSLSYNEMYSDDAQMIATAQYRCKCGYNYFSKSIGSHSCPKCGKSTGIFLGYVSNLTCEQCQKYVGKGLNKVCYKGRTPCGPEWFCKFIERR